MVFFINQDELLYLLALQKKVTPNKQFSSKTKLMRETQSEQTYNTIF